jgi:hypothetical protein
MPRPVPVENHSLSGWETNLLIAAHRFCQQSLVGANTLTLWAVVSGPLKHPLLKLLSIALQCARAQPFCSRAFLFLLGVRRESLLRFQTTNRCLTRQPWINYVLYTVVLYCKYVMHLHTVSTCRGVVSTIILSFFPSLPGKRLLSIVWPLRCVSFQLD